MLMHVEILLLGKYTILRDHVHQQIDTLGQLNGIKFQNEYLHVKGLSEIQKRKELVSIAILNGLSAFENIQSVFVAVIVVIIFLIVGTIIFMRPFGLFPDTYIAPSLAFGWLNLTQCNLGHVCCLMCLPLCSRQLYKLAGSCDECIMEGLQGWK